MSILTTLRNEEDDANISHKVRVHFPNIFKFILLESLIQ
jgi:hypothetical protein